MESQIRRAALDKLERKLRLPQYREYMDNEDAQMVLMIDCLREVEMEARTCEKRQQRHSIRCRRIQRGKGREGEGCGGVRPSQSRGGSRGNERTS